VSTTGCSKSAFFSSLLGLTGVSLDLNLGGQIPYERVVRSIRLLTEQVIPEFK